jgi:phytoene synthase
MSPEQYCKEKSASSGSSFYYSFLFLDPQRRDAIMALYAFCREVDDIVDNDNDGNIAQAKLNWWKQEIENTFRNNPQHPVTRSLAKFIVHYQLEQQYFDLIIEGMSLDLTKKQYQTNDELDHYCFRAASAVGVLSAQIFGVTQANTLRYAEVLGLALQKTNILRDIKEDLDRGRIYIPTESLVKAGIQPDGLQQSIASDNYKRLILDQIEAIEPIYEQALSLLPDEDKKHQKAGLIMAAIYKKILKKIARNPKKAFEQRQTLAPLNKLWIAWRVWSSE